MPACPISAPPSLLTVTSIWPSPFIWLLLIPSVIYIVLLFVLRPTSKRGWPKLRNRLMIRGVCVIMLLNSLYIFLFISMPALNMRQKWFDSQFNRFASGDCNLSKLFSDNYQLSLIANEWSSIALGLSLIAALLLIISFVLDRVKLRSQ